MVASSLDILRKADGVGRPESLRSGEVLIREGTVGRDVFVLVSGSLIVTRTSDGVTVVISTIDEPGSVIGEIAPLAGGERIATVTAAETTRVIALAADGFYRLLDDDPALAAELSAGAVRRAEEAELVQLLGTEFSLTDPIVVAAVRDSVLWVRLTPGEILFHEGDEPDSVYLVIRGGLQATSWDEIESTEVVLGHIGRGEIVGEVGLLGSVERMATVTALRPTVLARIPAAAFESLIESHPRLMIEVGLAMTTRGRGAGRRTRERVVLAVAVSDRLDHTAIVSGVAAELARVGSVEHLWPEKVDAILGATGIAGAGPGVLGDVRLGRLLSETELAADHLLLDVSRSTGSWATRALAMADRVLIVVPPEQPADELGRLEGVLTASPSGVPRTVAIVHPATTSVPSNTASLVDRFKATDVVNLGAGDAEVRRLARTVVGRGFDSSWAAVVLEALLISAFTGPCASQEWKSMSWRGRRSAASWPPSWQTTRLPRI